MKRDFDLVRSILIQVEEAKAGQPIMQMSAPAGVDGPTFIGHLQMMIDQGLIKGEVLSTQETVFAIEGLTWQGHDFLDSARDDSIWNKAKAKAEKVGGSVSFDVFKALLVQLMKAHLGLP